MFYIHGSISKSHLRLFLRRAETFLKFRRCMQPHACLFRHRQEPPLIITGYPIVSASSCPSSTVIDRLFATRNDRNARMLPWYFLPPDLLPRLAITFAGRSDKCDVALLTKFCKTGCFPREIQIPDELHLRR